MKIIGTNNTPDTLYTNYEVLVKNTKYHILVASGKFNYVSVKKVTANPWGLCGKEFKNLDEATQAYKSPELKLAFLKIEMGL